MPKALVPVAGHPLVRWCCDALDAAPDVTAIVVVAPPDSIGLFMPELVHLATPTQVVAGGDSRAASVMRGLEALGDDVDRVLVHDAARPMLSTRMVAEVVRAMEGCDGAIIAAPLADTLKRVDDGGIVGSPSREGLWCAQTPQAFPVATLRDASRAAHREGRLAAATDCSSLVEAVGGTVRVVHTHEPNPKVTIPADLVLVEALLAARASAGGGG